MCTLASTTNSFSTPTRTRATEAPRLPAVHRQPPKRWRFSFAYSSSVAPSPFLSALEDAAYPVVATPLLLEAVRSAAAATVEAATAAATVAQPSTPSSAVTLAAASAAATSFTAAATATATATASAAAQAVARLAAESDDVPAPSNASSSPRSRSAGNTLSQSLKHAHALPGNAVLLESALELVSPARRPAGIATDFEQLQRASASEKTPLMSGPGGLGSNFFTFQGSVVCSHTRLQESRTRTGNKLRTKIEESLASLEREFESSRAATRMPGIRFLRLSRRVSVPPTRLLRRSSLVSSALPRRPLQLKRLLVVLLNKSRQLQRGKRRPTTTTTPAPSFWPLCRRKGSGMRSDGRLTSMIWERGGCRCGRVGLL
ncbi:hypothetical protein DFJ73DRAFT_436702 [Zopfochytrium polystomum]|nr:hypothetical protein DFJ73DRAFT_436702 [Zopfochytrium polystomum]